MEGLVGLAGPKGVEFRFPEQELSEHVMVSHKLNCWFFFTTGRIILSPNLSEGVLNLLCEL